MTHPGDFLAIKPAEKISDLSSSTPSTPGRVFESMGTLSDFKKPGGVTKRNVDESGSSSETPELGHEGESRTVKRAKIEPVPEISVLDIVPRDVLKNIFTFLNFSDFKNILLTCKTFSSIGRDVGLLTRRGAIHEALSKPVQRLKGPKGAQWAISRLCIDTRLKRLLVVRNQQQHLEVMTLDGKLLFNVSCPHGVASVALDSKSNFYVAGSIWVSESGGKEMRVYSSNGTWLSTHTFDLVIYELGFDRIRNRILVLFEKTISVYSLDMKLQAEFGKENLESSVSMSCTEDLIYVLDDLEDETTAVSVFNLSDGKYLCTLKYPVEDGEDEKQIQFIHATQDNFLFLSFEKSVLITAVDMKAGSLQKLNTLSSGWRYQSFDDIGPVATHKNRIYVANDSDVFFFG
jgi:hypothetical protein